MGVNGLWQLLAPTEQSCTLNDISLMNGFSASNKEKIPRIGVDISTMMNECVATDHASHIYQHRNAGALRTFFYKLCKFLREAPVIMIFVFDGPNRPSFKHGRNTDTHAVPEWSHLCKSFIEAFGFYWHQAPGEAEAELAMLSGYDAIDAVMTSDSDAFVFGAQCVVKSVPHPSHDQYLLFSMDVVENTVGLSRGGLILVALLSRGDYSGGLNGCGPNISALLARCGFGDRILQAVQKLEDIKLNKELDLIVGDIQNELRNNSSGLLNSCYPKLASNFNVDYISPEKVSAYLDPIVSTMTPSTVPSWISKEPSIHRISQLCIQVFDWAPNDLESKLANVLWPGIFLRILTSPLLVYNDANKLCLTSNTQTKIVRISVSQRRKKSGQWARVLYTTGNFVALLDKSAGKPRQLSLNTWVPAQYLPPNLAAISSTSELSCPSRCPSVLQPPRVSPLTFPLLFADNPSSSTSEPDIILESSASPDPPSINDILNSAGRIHKAATNTQSNYENGQPIPEANSRNFKEVVEIRDSESEVEIICVSRKRTFSEAISQDDVIVISD